MGLQVLLLAVQYQNHCSFGVEDLVNLHKLPRVFKNIETLSEKFDCSELLGRLISSSLQGVFSQADEEASVFKFISRCLTSTKLMNLKVSYTITTILLQRLVASEDPKELIRSSDLLQLVRKHDL